ncbi:hypothetical protein SGLAM104S_03370 [Streptomyces glaucescens]
MSVAPKASTPSWPTPPECGWTADDLDRLPNLPPHTELIDGSLVFVSPRTIFHERAVDFFKWQLQSLAPADLEVFREFTTTDRQRPGRTWSSTRRWKIWSRGSRGRRGWHERLDGLPASPRRDDQDGRPGPYSIFGASICERIGRGGRRCPQAVDG